jgi:hypothetical protein
MMWIMLNDAFLSIVHKDCNRHELMVRARREGDIERIFPQANVSRSTDTDYLYRAVIPRVAVEQAMLGELRRITYSNFKDTVTDEPLHHAYLGVWNRMAELQTPRPFSERLPLKFDRLSPEEEAHVFATGHMPDETFPPPKRDRQRGKKAKKARRKSLKKGR